MAPERTVADLYPELGRVTLGAFVRRLLREVGYEPDRGHGATISTGHRDAQITTASVRRLFLFGLWDRGVSYGHGRTDSPRAMVDAIGAFVFEGRSVAEMSARFPFVELSAAAVAHERGALVEHRWAEYLAWDPASPRGRALLPVVREASRRPKLRRLLPFVDLRSLRFSRTTGYPYLPIEAWIERVTDGRWAVLTSDEGTDRCLGQGDAAWAARALDDAVADDLGAAVDGTAGDGHHC